MQLALKNHGLDTARLVVHKGMHTGSGGVYHANDDIPSSIKQQWICISDMPVFRGPNLTF